MNQPVSVWSTIHLPTREDTILHEPARLCLVHDTLTYKRGHNTTWTSPSLSGPRYTYLQERTQYYMNQPFSVWSTIHLPTREDTILHEPARLCLAHDTLTYKRGHNTTWTSPSLSGPRYTYLQERTQYYMNQPVSVWPTIHLPTREDTILHEPTLLCLVHDTLTYKRGHNTTWTSPSLSGPRYTYKRGHNTTWTNPSLSGPRYTYLQERTQYYMNQPFTVWSTIHLPTREDTILHEPALLYLVHDTLTYKRGHNTTWTSPSLSGPWYTYLQERTQYYMNQPFFVWSTIHLPTRKDTMLHEPTLLCLVHDTLTYKRRHTWYLTMQTRHC